MKTDLRIIILIFAAAAVLHFCTGCASKEARSPDSQRVFHVDDLTMEPPITDLTDRKSK